MKYLSKAVLLAVFCFLPATDSCAAALTSQVEQIARKFSDSAATIGFGTTTIAVFPFEADEKLSRKKVDFAVSELLTHYILKQRTLQVTERAQLSSVLKEQRLGLSGAIDTKTAAGIGKVLGAELLALGNVTRLGNFYQITAKLVNAQTAELITSEIFEVPIEIFDVDAGPYLVLVPDKQAIGVFIMGNYGSVSPKNISPFSTNLHNISTRNPRATITSRGGGVRYWPTANWQIEASYAAFDIEGDREYDIVGAVYENATIPPAVKFSGRATSLIVSRAINLSRKFRLHLGAGALNIHGGTSYTIIYANLPSFIQVQHYARSFNHITPVLKSGVEWRPQERIGWAVFGNYNLLGKRISDEAYFVGAGQPETLRVWEGELPRFSIETTLALYF